MQGHCDLEDKSLAFCNNDPGAVKFGNFINYYSFHNVDKRTANLHPNMFPSSKERLLCLDVGCNTGELTQELYKYLKLLYPECGISILGIDIDPILIKRAQETNKQNNITFMTCNIMSTADRVLLKKHLDSFNQQYFNITFCFSVTMWIHLNNGDDGLNEFLKYIKSNSEYIIIEPQPWNCYKNAQRRLKKSGSYFETYESLKIRNNVEVVIENNLIKNNCKKVYESPQSSWNRRIQSYLCSEGNTLS